jgi:DNA-binding XRE family transcriptional regulator
MPPLTRLRDARQRAALSQADLAHAAGVARSTVVRLEQGEPDPLPSTVRKLAQALQCKPVDLMEARS